jgi:hypothetical protein
MHDRIATLKVLAVDVADVLAQVLVGVGHRFPGAPVKQANVAAYNRVPLLLQEIDQMRSDIAAMASDENFHVLFLLDAYGTGAKATLLRCL